MKRRARQLRFEAEERWPTLRHFLGYCHEDWPEMYGSPEGAIDTAISEYPLEMRQEALREWRDWNATAGDVEDVRDLLNDGFGVNVNFRKPIEGRNFMNSVYEKLIVSVRNETGERWKP